MGSQRANEQQWHGEWPMTRPKVAASNDESFQSTFSSTERTKTMNPSTPQPPIKEFRAGTVSASIWRNETTQDGETVVTFSTRIQKRIPDPQTKEWRATEYYFADDLADLELVVQNARQFTRVKEREPAKQADVA